MPVLPPNPNPIPAQLPGGTCSFKAIDIITQAMIEIGVLDPNETPTGPEANLVLIKLNRMLDSWNADKRYVYTVQFNQYPIVPNLQPHTIGPASGATFQVNQRPVKLESCQLILNNVTPEIRYPMNVRDSVWWSQKSAFAVSGSLPTDVYYEPDWPNGSLFLWPVPTTNYLLELTTWTVLGELQLASIFCMPPGYMDAVVYSLAIALCPSFATQPSPALALLAAKAIERIQSANIKSPRLGTRDAGIPKAEPARPYFNYLTGTSR